jgi:hypothetical protein
LLRNTILLLAVCAASCGHEEARVQGLAQSHADANVPLQPAFDSLLRADLATYFTSHLARDVKVDYELLRRGPTQTGIAYPKFYAWVRVQAGGTVEEGAVRLAAKERTRFEVTHFIPEAEIRRAPQSLNTVFPPAVADSIRKRLRLFFQNTLHDTCCARVGVPVAT